LKRLFTRVFAPAVLLSLSAISAFSQSDFAVRARVPFAFVAGDAVLPAGEYIIQQDNISSIVTLQGSGGAAAVLSAGTELPKSDSRTQLVFKRRGNQVVLTQIRLSDQPTRLISTGLSRTTSLK
jgi:hypothetical protein